MASESGQERTEQATPKRLREAREKGQIPRSRELNSMVLLMSAAGGLLVLGENMLTRLADVVRGGLSLPRDQIFNNHVMVASLGDALLDGLIILAPLLALLIVAAAVSPLGLGGLSFSTKAMSFKWEKLDPVKGLGRIFAWRGLLEMFKAMAKFLLVGGVSGLMLWSLTNEILGLGNEPLHDALSHTAQLFGWSFLGASSVLILLALVDVPFQLWDHARQLKMTLQEVKDELKEVEGHPEVKGRLRRMQQEMAQRRMMEEVPRADVIITNPTHFAVALRYDQTNMGAPRLVAKGADLVAARIRDIANLHDVTIVSAPPLARALYASADLNQEIPANLYVAVAHILSYVYQLKTVQQTGDEPPVQPADLPVPDEFL